MRPRLASVLLGSALTLVLLAVLAFSGVCVSCLGAAGVVVADRRNTTDVPVRVVSHAWKRSISLEELKREADEDWCADVPDDATILRRHEKLRDRERGLGRRTKEIYAEWCAYEVLRWSRVKAATAEGEGTSPAPTWPDVPVETCETEGCRRPGGQSETYTLVLAETATGKEHRCFLEEPVWRSIPDGADGVLPVGEYVGLPKCDAFQLR